MKNTHRIDTVESRGSERKFLSIGDHELTRQSLELEALPTQPDGSPRQIDPVGLSALAGVAAQDIAIAAADVEHAFSGELRVFMQSVRKLNRFCLFAEGI